MYKEVNVREIEKNQLCGLCDHTFLLRPEVFRGEGKSAVKACREELIRFLEDTISSPLKPYAVCVRAEEVKFTHDFLDGTDIVVAATAGFPDGATPTELTIVEARFALDNGAKEVDMVLDTAAFKAGDEAAAIKDIAAVEKVVHDKGGLLKLILETSELKATEIERACQLADEMGVDFVKTSTGFSAYGARAEDLSIMARVFPRGIKISGGVTENNVRDLLAAAAGGESVVCDPKNLRIGESSLLQSLATS